MRVSMSALVLTGARAVILGVFLGAVYDLFRIVKCLLRISDYGGRRRFEGIYKRGVKDVLPRRAGRVFSITVTAVCDVLYSVVFTVCFILFLYAFNHGIFRWFIFASCAAGVLLYHVSLGRLVIGVTGAAADFLRFVINVFLFALFYPLKRAAVSFKKVSAPAIFKIRSALDKRRNRRYTLKCIKELDKFFVFQGDVK